MKHTITKHGNSLDDRAIGDSNPSAKAPVPVQQSSRNLLGQFDGAYGSVARKSSYMNEAALSSFAHMERSFIVIVSVRSAQGGSYGEFDRRQFEIRRRERDAGIGAPTVAA